MLVRVIFAIRTDGFSIRDRELKIIFLIFSRDIVEYLSFLIATKLMLGFSAVRQEIKLSEYVIISTPALILHLLPLGISDFTL